MATEGVNLFSNEVLVAYDVADDIAGRRLNIKDDPISNAFARKRATKLKGRLEQTLAENPMLHSAEFTIDDPRDASLLLTGIDKVIAGRRENAANPSAEEITGSDTWQTRGLLLEGLQLALKKII